MGTARLIESFWTCQKRYRLERWIEAQSHDWPSPRAARVGEPVCAAECVARVLSWLDSRDEPHGYLPASGAPEDVELAAGWAGRPGLLWEGLVATGWVVARQGRWQWHDYAAVNGIVIQSRLRKRRERDRQRDGVRDEPRDGGRDQEAHGARAAEGERDEPRDQVRDEVRDRPRDAGAKRDQLRDAPRDPLGPEVPRSRGPDVQRSRCPVVPSSSQDDDDDDDDGRARASLPEAAPAPGGDAEGRALGAMRASYERAFVLRRWAAPGHAEEAEALVRLAMRRHGVEVIQEAFERWIQEHRNGSPPQIYRFAKDPTRWIPTAAGASEAQAPVEAEVAERRLWLETLEEERGRGARENQEAEWRAAGIRY